MEPPPLDSLEWTVVPPHSDPDKQGERTPQAAPVNQRRGVSAGRARQKPLCPLLVVSFCFGCWSKGALRVALSLPASFANDIDMRRPPLLTN